MQRIKSNVMPLRVTDSYVRLDGKGTPLCGDDIYTEICMSKWSNDAKNLRIRILDSGNSQENCPKVRISLVGLWNREKTDMAGI